MVSGVTTPTYVRVALPVPLGRTFTYALPAELEVTSGSRVLVELRSRKVLGVVLDVGTPPEIDPDRIKPIFGVVDREPVLEPELLAFLRELARYYVAPMGEVLRLALPAVEREAQRRLRRQGAEVSAVGKLALWAGLVDAPLPEGLKGHSLEIVQHLAEVGPTPVAELVERWGTARTLVKRLAERGVVTTHERAVARDPFFSEPAERDVPPEPTEAQSRAVAALGASLAAGHGGAFLLRGVTGSGKTEVYLRAVQAALARGRGAIVLVPEIALTPQLVTRFRARLGDAIAVLHSGLSEGDRHTMWRALRRGELSVAVGARSALFAPVRDLGLVVVDEEHDSSFKQEEGVRYSARDMALLRAQRAGASCVLGSATPSLASFAAVAAGKLELLTLPDRARASARLPRVELVDLRRIGPAPGGDRTLSIRLYRELERVLAAGQQAILFLNRRGFAPSLSCSACGEPAECPNCDVALTFHRAPRGELRCHYCDLVAHPPEKCARCGSPELELEGTGTERVEATLSQLFPRARIARLDRDVAAGLKSAAVLDRMRSGDIDILVGTQMVTKGHDLPRVTLVGVLNADASLSIPDFRAAERTFHLLVQVAGRAGRGDDAGLVLVQTRRPDHPAIALAARHDVDAFVEQELRDRRELPYPPYSRLALVKFDGTDERQVIAETARIAALARAAAPRGVVLLGPTEAPLARLRNRWRHRFMLRGADRAALRPPLLAVARAAVSREVRLTIDVDPLSML